MVSFEFSNYLAILKLNFFSKNILLESKQASELFNISYSCLQQDRPNNLMLLIIFFYLHFFQKEVILVNNVSQNNIYMSHKQMLIYTYYFYSHLTKVFCKETNAFFFSILIVFAICEIWEFFYFYFKILISRSFMGSCKYRRRPCLFSRPQTALWSLWLASGHNSRKHTEDVGQGRLFFRSHAELSSKWTVSNWGGYWKDPLHTE